MSDPIRVRCTLETVGPTVNGIRFGRIEHESGEVLHVSEPVDPEAVAAMLTIEGFARFEASPEACAAIDEAIASQAMAEVAEAAGDSDAQRTIRELQHANQAMAAELAEARRTGDPAEVQRLTAELAEARSQRAGAGAAEATEKLEQANAALEDAVTELRAKLTAAEGEVAAKGAALDTAAARIAELEQANAALAESAGAPADKGGRKQGK